MKGIGHLPSVDNLMCFVAAAHHLNFRRASEEMAITPTAFGQRIAQLEERLGEELLYRTTRHVELTEAGRALLPVAEEAIERVRRCERAAHRDLETLPARFSLGTRFELGMSWVVPALTELRETYPHWTIDVYFGSGPDILERLDAGKLDCIITSAPVAQANWESEFLHAEKYVFCASRELLERESFDGPEDASNHVLLDINRELPLMRYLSSVGPPLHFDDVLLCGATAAICDFVKRGFGVAVLPEYMIGDELDDGALVPLLPEVEPLDDAFRLLFRRESSLRMVMSEFAARLRDRPLE